MKEKIGIWFMSLLCSVATYFMPVIPLLTLIGLFLFCDFLSAIAAAYHVKEGFRFKLLLDSIPKAIIYAVIVVVAFVVEVNYFPGTNLAKLITGAVALRELRSIDKNAAIVLGASPLKLVINAFKVSGKK